MNSVWTSLLWKEWREHRWKVLVMSLCSLFLLWLTKPKGALHQWPEQNLGWVALASAVFAAVVGTGVAARENSQATRSFIESQPIAMRRLAVVKLLVGAILVLSPSLFATAFFAVVDGFGSRFWPELAEGLRWFGRVSNPGHSPISTAEQYFLVTAAPTLSVYLWVAALGASATNEVRAAALGLGGIVAWILMIIFVSTVVDRTYPPNAVKSLGLAGGAIANLGPLGFYFGIAVFGKTEWLLYLILACSFLSHLFVAGVYVYRFGKPVTVRSAQPGQRQAEKYAQIGYLAPPMRSPLAALAWKGARECLPIFVIALAGGVVTPAVAYALAYWAEDNLEVNFSNLGAAVGLFMAWAGGIVAVVSGIGSVSNDLTTRINVFWRSRPIRPDAAFWTPFLTAAVFLLVVFALPSDWLLTRPSIARFWEGEMTLEPWDLTVAFFFAFATAACFACVTRHAIYAALLAFGTAICVSVAAHGFDATSAYANVLLLALTCVASVAAWLAFRYDWAIRA